MTKSTIKITESEISIQLIDLNCYWSCVGIELLILSEIEFRCNKNAMPQLAANGKFSNLKENYFIHS